MSSNNTSTTAATSTTKPATTPAATTTSHQAGVSITDDITNIFTSIFSSSNMVLLLWSLAIYFVGYAVLGLFNSNLTGPDYMLKIIDVILMISIFAYLISYNYSNPDSIKNLKTTTYNTLNNSNTLIYTGIFLVCYTAAAFVFHIPTSGLNAPLSLWLLSTLAIIVFTITAIVLFCKYVLGISILDNDALKSFWSGKSADKTDKSADETDKSADKTTPSVSGPKQEVFNVSNNLYTYDDARAVCKALDSRLATYDEIEQAYNKGGEWCSYGWSEGQMAYFPTQKSTWAELQKNPNAKNNCGRPGVNGGYMDNPYLKFGVNCYGTKPKPSDKDLQAMASNKLQPKTEEDTLIDKKVQFWKDNADKLLNLNAFNRKNWSEY
jgi:hypothetical protein